jgi:hypothetical protein
MAVNPSLSTANWTFKVVWNTAIIELGYDAPAYFTENVSLRHLLTKID